MYPPEPDYDHDPYPDEFPLEMLNPDRKDNYDLRIAYGFAMMGQSADG